MEVVAGASGSFPSLTIRKTVQLLRMAVVALFGTKDGRSTIAHAAGNAKSSWYLEPTTSDSESWRLL
jgi:hypothetical protein